MPEPIISTEARPTVLFIDDDRDVQKAASLLLPRRGFDVRAAHTPEEAWSILAAGPVDVVLLDLNFSAGAVSGAEGMRCLAGLIAHDPDAVVIVVTGHSGITIAVAAMRAGATDFVMKPWNNDRLIATLTDAVSVRRQRRAAHAPADRGADDALIIGESPAMRGIRAAVPRVAATDAAILLIGEAGVGKSLLATCLHRASPRAAAPLVSFDPAAAWRYGEAGWAQAAAAVTGVGTLFIDEIGLLPGVVQARLLELLRRQAGVRVIAATRQPRGALAGMLNADLLYALNTVELVVPPLRERGGDIRLLTEHFLRLFALRHARLPMGLPEATAEAIAANPWPGNVRALRQAVERAVVLGQREMLLAEDVLPAGLADGAVAGAADLNLLRSEKAVVVAALQRHGFNVSHAARELGLTRAALYRRMARHGL